MRFPLRGPAFFRLLAVFLAVLAPGNVRAHIGSPNVFFEGNAGPHSIRVVIRPPGTLPGLAQVDVQIHEDDAATVIMRVYFTGQGNQASAPPAIVARPVPGDPQRFTATVPLIHSGTHRVEIQVESPRGDGLAVVPLQASATRLPSMITALRVTLIALGLLLAVGAVVIVRAAAAIPNRRRATICAIVIVAGAIGTGGARWEVIDRRFRSEALAQPIPVRTEVVARDTHHLLRLRPTIEHSPFTRWNALVTDHGKLIHLFLVRHETLDAFAHVHPVRRDARRFETVLPPLPAGTYDLFGEVTYENGVSETLTGSVELPTATDAPLSAITTTASAYETWCRGAITRRGDAAEPIFLDPDDSWSTVAVSEVEPGFANLVVTTLPSGHRVVFHEAGPGMLHVNRASELRFSVFTTEGEPAAIQPYMGMRAHAAVRSRDGQVFAHLHPNGSFSMAAQTIASGSTASDQNGKSPAEDDPRHEITIPYAFPRPGAYRLWLQFRVEETIQTASFDVEVGGE